MSHIITYTEEIEEHVDCQECPDLRTGDKYLHEEGGRRLLRIVISVRLTNMFGRMLRSGQQ